MAKFKVTCYPNQNSYTTTVEANSIAEAIEYADDKASINCYFMATPDDVEEL